MKRSLWWAAWPVALLVIFVAALWLGVTGGTLGEALATLFGAQNEQSGVMARHRLPRAVAATVIGAHLGLAGAILQIVLRNPLADPTILGISGGASLAVVLALSAAISLSPARAVISVASDYLPLALVPPIALAGGLAATAMVLALSWDRRLGSVSGPRMLLSGVVLGSVLSAAVMALVLALSEARTELAIQWLSGSLYARGFEQLLPTLPFTFLGLLALISLAPCLSALRFDPHTAMSTGVNTRLALPLLIIVATGLAASAVAVAGPIGFVGLLAPHIARRVGDQNLPAHLWSTCFIGAMLVVAGDTFGRLAAPPLEIPVGMVTSLIGAPVFAFMLARNLRSGHVPAR